MFYHPKDGHGLPHDPFKAIISPRPIAWVSTRDAQGRDNLAPYSFFNAIASDPPQVMFASNGQKPDRDNTKDTVGNARDTGVFCVNIVSHALRDAMNASAANAARETDEFALANLAKSEAQGIDCAYVSDAPAVLECRVTQIIDLIGDTNIMVMGEVVGVHLADACVVDGAFDVTKYQPLARMGYMDYTTVRDVFQLQRPK
ncbi:flavin reductase family protein [Yoonia sp. 208BN28-4]|uniref:flavin reductase family protein n=1 Tax=Yoonia sp. 208BN28-4 TaxID=3126505 RepID=UPI0030A77FA7